MHHTYHIKKSVNGQYYFTIVARNNKVIATSEMYKRKANCYKGIYAILDAGELIKDYTKK